ncbi:MAG: hypothetical protein ACJAR1_002494 [Rubritalea sp.]|jgi:hypothetical protein
MCCSRKCIINSFVYENTLISNPNTSSCKMSLIFNLENFEYHPFPEILEFIKNRPTSPGFNEVAIINEIRPCDLYIYLYAKFGPPNGLQNALRNKSSDNLIHWDWTFVHSNGLLVFNGMNQRTSLQFVGDWDFDLINRDQVIRSIQEDFKNYGSQMSKVRKGLLEKWETFINPYQNLESSISQMEEELDSLKINPNYDKFSQYDTVEEMKKSGLIVEELNSRYIRAYGISKSLEALIPVLAESFINLVILICLKVEVKKNDRLRETFIRGNIDIKIQSLHMYCNEFEKAVDWKSKACIDYNKVINERNDILHGNIVISKLKTGDIYFNGNVPVYQKYDNLWEQFFEKGLKASGHNEISQSLLAVREFIEYVLSCMTKEGGELIRHCMLSRELGKNLENDRIGVLLPNHMVDLMPSRVVV